MIYTWDGRLLNDYGVEVSRGVALAQYAGEQVDFHIGSSVGLGTGANVTRAVLSPAALAIADGVRGIDRRGALAALQGECDAQGNVPSGLWPLAAKTTYWRERYE